MALRHHRIANVKETALESLRRYTVYSQLIEAYQFVNCHPNMAKIIIGVGIGLHLPSILYYSCYYLNYIANIYCTVIPNLMTLYKLGNETTNLEMNKFKPPYYIFLFCALNLVTCYVGLVSLILCLYLLLPMKGKYLATVEKKRLRRRQYCFVLSAILCLLGPYQISLSLLRSIRFLRLHVEPNHLIMLSAKALSDSMHAQGPRSFWTLHAYQNTPCCLSHEGGADHFILQEMPPPECCQAYQGKEVALIRACRSLTNTGLLWPHCVSVVLNITSDIEITMDTQMQLHLLISCVIMFVIKYALHPHIRMLCTRCQSTYGWLEMKRIDN